MVGMNLRRGIHLGEEAFDEIQGDVHPDCNSRQQQGNTNFQGESIIAIPSKGTPLIPM